MKELYSDKESTHQKDLIIQNVYVPNHRDENMGSKMDKTERRNTISRTISGNFNMPLSKMDRKTRKKIIEGEINSVINQ